MSNSNFMTKVDQIRPFKAKLDLFKANFDPSFLCHIWPFNGQISLKWTSIWSKNDCFYLKHAIFTNLELDLGKIRPKSTNLCRIRCWTSNSTFLVKFWIIFIQFWTLSKFTPDYTHLQVLFFKSKSINLIHLLLLGFFKVLSLTSLLRPLYTLRMFLPLCVLYINFHLIHNILAWYK